MNPGTLGGRWLLLPLGGVVAAAALVFSGGLSSAQTPEPTNTPTETPTPVANDYQSYDALLADELGISEAELTDARDNARDAYIDQLVDADVLTQAEADDLKAWLPDQLFDKEIDLAKLAKARSFVITQIADAFDMDRDELEQDLADGMSLKQIAEAQDVTVEDLGTQLRSRIDDMIDFAVGFGVLTEQQGADLSDGVSSILDAIVSLAGDDAVAVPDATAGPHGTPTVTAP